MNKLLQIRLSIIMRVENYTFITSLYDFQNQLKLKFQHEANLDEIENALYKLEETYINNLEEESKQIIEFPEDFQLK